MGRKKKNHRSAPKRLTRYQQDEAAQATDVQQANLAAAAASAYSLPPPPPAALLVSEDPLGAADGISDAHKYCDGVNRAVCLDVQARGEKAVTLRVPETLPADPVVTNIRGHRCISCHQLPPLLY